MPLSVSRTILQTGPLRDSLVITVLRNLKSVYPMNASTLTLIDGPTLLIELGGLRILTDPTFDEPQVFNSSGARERKFNSPPVSAESLLPIDIILLSHDQHPDNLDAAGRAFLPRVGRVVSTVGAAERLGGNTLGLAPWSSTERCH